MPSTHYLARQKEEREEKMKRNDMNSMVNAWEMEK